MTSRAAGQHDAVASAAVERTQGITSLADAHCGQWLADVDVDAALLQEMPVGAALSALLAFTDPNTLTPDAQLAYLAATERSLAWMQTLQNGALVAFAGVAPRTEQHLLGGKHVEFTDARRTELALELLWSEQTAHAKLTTARELADSLPATSAALSAGRISALRAQAVCEGAQRLLGRVDEMLDVERDPRQRQALENLRVDMLAAYEQRTVRYAINHDLSRTRQQCRRAVVAIDPAGAALRRARAERELSDVTVRHDDDGMSWLNAYLPSERAVACLQRIDAEAARRSSEDRTTRIGVHRVQTFVDLLLAGDGGAGSVLLTSPEAAATAREPSSMSRASEGGTTGGSLGPRTAHRMVLNVTIDAASLLALRDESVQLRGAGPIPAAVVRELLATADASMRWLITDRDTGTLQGLSPRTYRLGSALREFIAARDGTCRMPNCTRPAEHCEVDHVEEFHGGGTSTPENLGLLCRRHHQAKTLRAIDLTTSASVPAGGIEVLSAHGTRHASETPPVSPDIDAADARVQSIRAALRELELRAAQHSRYAEPLSAEARQREQELTLALERAQDHAFLASVAQAREEGLLAVLMERVLDRHHRATCPEHVALPHRTRACTHLRGCRPPQNGTEPKHRIDDSDEPGF